EGQVICASGRLSVRDEKAPQLMCDTAYPLEAGGEAPPSQLPTEAAPASALAKKTLYLRLPSMDSEEMAHVRRVLFMFEGRENPVKIRLADTGKLLGTTCTLLDSLVREMRETLGEENVVVK
ncbi:MAG: DNA polymerase III subunit alpha, partial [Oscillospiraceae bacterium]|nr:DNA polymerase III subunit alpha [Oscillospiraceae bacterium]